MSLGPRRALLDTNLLLLWLVAETDPKILSKFKRVEEFGPEDIELLRKILRPYRSMVTTPHVLAETSNFIDQAPPPYRGRLVDSLKRFVANIDELYSPASRLVARSEFNALGLTDTGLAEISDSVAIISRDFRLVGTILAFGGTAINFTQSRSSYLLIP